MKLFNISLIALGSASLLVLGAFNSTPPATKIEANSPNLTKEQSTKGANSSID